MFKKFLSFLKRKKRRSRKAIKLSLKARPNVTARPVGWQKDLMKYLRKELNSNPGFFNTLEILKGDRGVPKRVLDFRGKKVVIKRDPTVKDPDIAKRGIHGGNYEKIRKLLLAHQAGVLEGKINPKSYVLRSIKVYGRIGEFLVMDYVQGKGYYYHYFLPYSGTSGTIDLKDVREAKNEIEQNFCKVVGVNQKHLQFFDMIVAGKTNPAHPEKGKWIFYLPYDMA